MINLPRPIHQTPLDKNIFEDKGFDHLPSLQEVVDQYIMFVYNKTREHKARSCRALKISRSTLYRELARISGARVNGLSDS